MPFVDPTAWRPKGVADLEHNAWSALREVHDNVSVVASAGSGKTEFLAQKADYLLTTGLCRAPRQILAISFKVDAARTLKARVRERSGPDFARRLHSVTYAAFTKSIVDRFRMLITPEYRPAADYVIAFESWNLWTDLKQRAGVQGATDAKVKAFVATERLPHSQTDKAAALLDAYWEGVDETVAGHGLYFSMIDRLAEHIIRCNPAVRAALLATYPFVFLDEFQDTTTGQYDTLRSCFLRTGSQVTAVGDDKQRIMGWAGAIPNAFSTFTPEFDAKRYSLTANWRSHEALAQVQHAMGQAIDPELQAPIASHDQTIGGAPAVALVFTSLAHETQALAKWVGSRVGEGEFAPHDCAILVRKKASDVASQIAPVFAENGVRIRNLAQSFGAQPLGQISLEDLLNEALVNAILPLLSLATRFRDAAAWQDSIETLEMLFDLDDEADKSDRAQTMLVDIIARIKGTLQDAPLSPDGARTFMDSVFEILGRERLKRLHPTYALPGGLARVETGLRLWLAECVSKNASWEDVVDDFKGVGSLPLMTIHKAKGTEYHTAITLGVDSRWGRIVGRPEEERALYVAVTRPRQRAIITATTNHGGIGDDLSEMLVSGGWAMNTPQ